MSDHRSVEDLAGAARRTFEEIHRRVFLGDPAANPRLKVEVAEAALVEDTPTLILITPWTINGMAFPPDGVFPEALVVGAKEYPVLAHSLDELGPYQQINLMSDVSGLASPDSARAVARSVGEPFRAAVAAARQAGSVPNPERRNLLLGRVRSEP